MVTQCARGNVRAALWFVPCVQRKRNSLCFLSITRNSKCMSWVRASCRCWGDESCCLCPGRQVWEWAKHSVCQEPHTTGFRAMSLNRHGQLAAHSQCGDGREPWGCLTLSVGWVLQLPWGLQVPLPLWVLVLLLLAGGTRPLSASLQRESLHYANSHLKALFMCFLSGFPLISRARLLGITILLLIA